MNQLNLIDSDYVLAEGAAWFSIKDFSIRIHSTDEGVVVDIYKADDEMNEPIASTYAFDSETQEDISESYEQRVQALEDEGLTRSDAQGVVDAEILKEAT